MTLEKFVSELQDESQPLKHAGLLQLSSLAGEDLYEFKNAWYSLPEPRKGQIMSKLVELNEDHAEMDFTAMYRALLNDENDDVREQAAKGLWECDDRVVIRPLIGLLKKDPSARVRAAAATSLAKFTDLFQQGKILSRDGDKIRDALLEVIGEEEEEQEVRRRCIEAVGSFNTIETGEIIREAYGSNDASMRQSAIYAMGRSSDIQWLRIVMTELDSSDPAMRYEAANAGGLLGEESTVPRLIALVKDEDSEVQVAAVQALGNIGGALAKRALQQAARKGEDAVEEAAQEALANLDFDEDPLGFRFQA
ncbi:MAG: HEAT repeat domain-containing protein [Chloroflexi bacterium]|nr:HEAT repeat domain-containing protein [Chloroflexota bacterium]MCH9039459.1 HEAT repeat domain-containing protein [Chloroflexota bacterium]MCI0822314.1 HEAT repeat domain-containing protein [Chloroflexota bacterium]